MDTLNDDWPFVGRKAIKSLNVIVVGAGIGGLIAGLALSQTGHKVTVLETASELAEIGAGIQLAPNASRILHRLGLLEQVMEYATVLERISIRRYKSDDELSSSPLMPVMGLKYGAPMSVIHRADLQRVLLNAARDNGCEILTSHTVLAADPSFSGRVQVRNTKTNIVSWFTGDIIIAADGTKSTLRKQIVAANGGKDQPTKTGDAAYRLLIPREKIEHEPMLVDMLDQNVGMRYMGPGGHVMAYPVKNNLAYNLVLIHPAKVTGGNDGGDDDNLWTSKGDRQEMIDCYQAWSPAIRKWIEYAGDEVLEWDLYVYPQLQKWVQGSVALIGDACHPMLPYVAQGAANAMEDAAVLAMALTCTSDVELALNVYELVRKDRGERIAASASTTAATLHLPDGPAQADRDRAIIACSDGKQHPDKWGDSQWQDFMWGVDIMKDTIVGWDELVSRTEVKTLPTVHVDPPVGAKFAVSKTQPRHAADSMAKTRRKTAIELFLKMKGETDLGCMAKALLLSSLDFTGLKIIEQPNGQQTPLELKKEGIESLATVKPWTPNSWQSKPIKQSPVYADPSKLASAVEELSRLPPIVHPSEVDALKAHLRDVAQGKAFLLQGGDCAELFEYCRQDRIEAQLRLFLQMSVTLAHGLNRRVVCVGRMAGQYAKPRSSPMEKHNGGEIPSFRGDILNGFGADERELDPSRLVKAYHNSSATLNYMRAAATAGITDISQNPLSWNLEHIVDPELKEKYAQIVSGIEQTQRFLQTVNTSSSTRADLLELYTSHEGLVLDYEQALTRQFPKKPYTSSFAFGSANKQKGSAFYNTSAHFLWIGDRTRQIDHAHVEFFRGVTNPIGIKIGPTTELTDILALLRIVNPDCEVGKVTLITRYGAAKVRFLLPAHIRAVEGSEYRGSVVWQCDPMHGNTVTACGTKTRRFHDVCQELRETLDVHAEQGSHLGGIHLEMTAEAVTECTGGGENLEDDDLAANYTTLCDPRLNEKQSIELALLVSNHFLEAGKANAAK